MTTIAYQGIAPTMDKVHKVVAEVQKFSVTHGWQIESNDVDSIVVTPHPKCESISIVFDKHLSFSDFTKTVYAPVEIHHQIVVLFLEIKPLLKKLTIDDGSGYWDSFLEANLKKKIKEIVFFPEVKKEAIISGQLMLPEHSTKADKEFWAEDYDNRDPYFENRLLLHYPTIRNRMGYELSNGTGFAFVADDIVTNLGEEGFVAYDSEFFQMYDHHYIESIAILWAWRHSIDKPTELKRKRCYAFASALKNGFNGGEKDGYGSKLHRDASIALDILLEREGPASPYRSLQIFYALFDFCHLKSNKPTV